MKDLIKLIDAFTKYGNYIINDNGRLSVMQKGEFEAKYEKIS